METYHWKAIIFISLFTFSLPIVTTTDSDSDDEIVSTTTSVTFFSDNESSATAACENATYLAAQILSAERALTDILSVKYIAGLIKLGKYKLAQNEFSNLNDPMDKVGRIVSEVYSEKETKKRYLLGKKVLHFLSNLELDSTCTAYPVAIQALNKQMDKYKKKSGSVDEESKYNDIPAEIILISDQFLTANCSKVSTAYATAEEGVQALRTLTIGLLEKWKTTIRRQDFEEIQKFCRAPKTFKSLKRFLPEIVRNAYGGNKTNFAAVDKFANELCHTQLTAVAMTALSSEVKMDRGGHSEEMLELGLSLKKFGANEGKKFDGNRATETLFGNLRRVLPKNMGKMIWGSRCTIRHQKTGDYVYAANDNETDTFTVVENKNGRVESGGWWQFNPWKKEGGNNENGLYWLIKSMEWERDKPYLCVRVNAKRKKEIGNKGLVETCYKTGFKNKKRMMANWILDPVIGTGGEKVFQLYSLDSNARRFYLMLEVEDDFEKKKKKAQNQRAKETAAKKKVVVQEVEDDEDDERESRILTDNQLLAKVDGYQSEESYWQIQCE